MEHDGLKTKEQLITELDSLRGMVKILEERVDSRSVTERIINTQLHSEIEQRKVLEHEINKTKQFLQSILDAIKEQIFLVSRDFKILWANKTFLDQYGCDLDQVKGNFCYAFTHHQDAPCALPNDACPLRDALRTGKPVVETHLHHGSKGDMYLEVAAYPIKDEKGEIIEFVHIARDITAAKKAEEELRALSLADPLTGLHNRRGFMVLAAQQMKVAKRNKQDMGLIFADMDGLKFINDRFGHQEGDAALRDAAKILSQSFRESDIIARIGGDEFAVLAIQANQESTDALTDSLRKNLAEANAVAGRKYPLYLSIGLAYCVAGSPCGIDDLLNRADKKMYEEKLGKKQVSG